MSPVFIPITIKKSATISSPLPDSFAWTGAKLVTMSGVEMIEVQTGDTELSLWAIGARAYSTRVSAAIDDVMAHQVQSSKDFLGFEEPAVQKTTYKLQQERKALRKLVEVAGDTLVEVCLPSFVGEEDERVPAVTTKMPCSTKPSKVYMEAKEDVLLWFYKKINATPTPCKRKAEKPPIKNGDASVYWHQTKNCYVEIGIDNEGKKSYTKFVQSGETLYTIDDSDESQLDNSDVGEHVGLPT